MYTGYGHMARFLSFPESWTESNKAFLKNMCGGINGALYYNVSAWQKLIDQIPFGKKAAQRLPELWGMDPAPFRPEQIKLKRAQKMRIYFRLTLSFLRFKKIRRDYLKIYNEVQEKITRTDLRVLMSGDLKKLYDEIHMRLGNNWSAPLINGFFTLVFLGAFKKLLKNSDLRDRYPNFFNDVLFSNDVISLKIIREFQAISETVRNDKPLLSLFETSDAAKILATLESDYPALHKRIREYIFLYGERCEDSELKLETITYQEEPAFFIKALQSTVHSGPAHTARRFDYKKALKEAYPLNFGKRWLFSWIIAQARERVKERENFRFMRTKAFGMLRKIFRTLDGELFQEKWIEKNGDSLYLELEEIFDSSRKAEYKEIIKKRKDAYARYAEQKSFPARFLAVEGKFSPVQAAVASGGEIIKGTGCCSGIVKSQVRILHEQETIGDVSGKIIVAAYIEPGKLSLFARAAGIVSVRGNLLSHTAILCREMGLPSIVGAKGAMNKLKDGDLVEMDGATGKIILLGHD
jgi:pyruvate,water dikinase